MVAAAIIGAGVIGAVGGVVSSGNAASAQTNAANQANQTELQMYNQTRSDLTPFQSAGKGALTGLNSLVNTGFNFNPTQAQIEATPGYKFNLAQGLKSVQNSAAARGLGSSGAAMKGAANFATGLADSTWQNQYNNALNTYQTNYNSKMGLASLGENAAAQTGSYGTQIANSVGNNLIGAGNAQAASDIAMGNAISGGANSIAQYYMMQNMLGGGGGGGTGMYGGGTGMWGGF